MKKPRPVIHYDLPQFTAKLGYRLTRCGRLLPMIRSSSHPKRVTCALCIRAARADVQAGQAGRAVRT